MPPQEAYYLKCPLKGCGKEIKVNQVRFSLGRFPKNCPHCLAAIWPYEDSLTSNDPNETNEFAAKNSRK